MVPYLTPLSGAAQPARVRAQSMSGRALKISHHLSADISSRGSSALAEDFTHTYGVDMYGAGRDISAFRPYSSC